MTVLTPPRHPLIDQALADAQKWCTGQVIDDRPALVHAVRVAVTLGAYTRGAQDTHELIVAALLHDSPEFAPPGTDLDAVLTQRYGGKVVRIVRALEAEHHALDTDHPTIPLDDLPVLLASSTDKIVALASLSRRARASGDPVAFFTARPVLHGLLPHFHAFLAAGTGRVPTAMTLHLKLVLDALTATAQGRA